MRDLAVSVIIPCYNAGPYLAQAIGSAVEQTRPPREVIVVDDGSTDDSPSVARRMEARHPERVRVLRRRSGQAARTRNIGADQATGEALMFLDADDVLGPFALEALSTALAGTPEGVAIGPWYRLELEDGRWVKRPRSCADRRPGQDPLDGWLTGWWHPPCSVLWSRAGFERAGRWDERWNPNDDGDLMMRALIRGVPLVEATYGSSFYRRVPAEEGSLSGARFSGKGLQARAETLQRLDRFLQAHGKLQRYRTSLSEAYRRLASDARRAPGPVFDEARRRARELDPLPRRLSRPARLAHRSLRRRWWRVQDVVQRRLSPPDPEPAPPPEVRYGLDGRGARSSGSPAVSVILPTYNRAHLLPRALDSVLAQTFRDYEVLVVDDGSTDDTACVMERYAANHPEVRYLVQPANAGVSAARNRGLDEARGRYIALLDSDDEWFPHKLERQVEAMDRRPPSVGMLYGGVETVASGGETWIFRPEHRGMIHQTLLGWNVIHGTSGVLLRREAAEDVGGFDEGIPAIEDWDYWIRLSRRWLVDFLEEPLIRYYDSDDDALRKTLHTDENLEARAWLYRRHGAEMRREGKAYPFLLESARRHRDVAGDHEGARRLLWEAWKLEPFSQAAYLPLLKEELRRVLPRSGYRVLSRVYSMLRSRIARLAAQQGTAA